MDAREAITATGIGLLPAGTPVAIVGSRDGYAIAVGESTRVRWLHSTTGKFRMFKTLDSAARLLRECRHFGFTVNLSGGMPE